MTWLICEVQDGTAHIDGSDSVTELIIDWDNATDDRLYAADKLDELDQLTGELPPWHIERLRAALAALWPDAVNDPPQADAGDCPEVTA